MTTATGGRETPAMIDPTTRNILETCRDVHDISARIYSLFTGVAEGGELAVLWERMCEEELAQVARWTRLLELAAGEAPPPLFESPSEILGELRGVREQCEELLQFARSERRVVGTCLIACRLEFHTMHVAFERLLEFLDIREGTDGRERSEHLEILFKGLRESGFMTPEVDLIDEMTRRLWQKNRELARRSVTDPLTGVYNRRGLLQMSSLLCGVAKRGGQEAAVLMIDVDHFKRVNDTFGHQVGDDVLRRVADLLSERIRGSDLLGRYGGEEFLVFLSPVRREAVFDVAEEIRRHVENGTRDGLQVTVSVGCACRGDREESLETLIGRADAALYRAKEEGRNRVVVSP